MVITLKLDNNVKKSGLQSVFFNVSHGKGGQIGQIRKKIYTGLEVSAKQFDIKNFRAKSKHSNYQIINNRVDELKALQSVSQTKFDAGQYTTEQVILHLKGYKHDIKFQKMFKIFLKSSLGKLIKKSEEKQFISRLIRFARTDPLGFTYIESNISSRKGYKKEILSKLKSFVKDNKHNISRKKRKKTRKNLTRKIGGFW